MNDCMIVFKEIEPGNHALLQSPEFRKIDRILYLVMAVEVLQEPVEPWREKTLKAYRIEPALPEGDQCLVEFATLIAQQLVSLEPEGGQVAEVDVRSPFAARISRPEMGKLIRQAATAIELQRSWYCFGC